MLVFRLRFHWILFPKGPINNIPALVQMMACCRSGDKPLSEPIMVSLLKFICVTRPQWVRWWRSCGAYLRQWTGSSLVQVVARHRSVHMLNGHRGTNSNQSIWFPFDENAFIVICKMCTILLRTPWTECVFTEILTRQLAQHLCAESWNEIWKKNTVRGKSVYLIL